MPRRREKAPAPPPPGEKRPPAGGDGRLRPFLRACAGAADLPAPPSSPFETRAWAAAGLAVLLAAVLVLERMQPFYFTQDDVFSSELPGIVQACRSISRGEWPEWNRHQFMGAPSSSLGLISATYPPTYLSYAVARHLLGGEQYTIEVFAVAHLAAGFLATLWLLALLGLRPALAAPASLTFVLSGATLVMGRSWHAVVPIVVWLPLVVGMAVRLRDGPVGRRWAALTALLLGAHFHVGFSQYWAYTVMAFVFVVLLFVLSGAVPWRRALWAVPALLGGAAIAAPLLVGQVAFSAGIFRSAGYGTGIREGLAAMLLPWPLAAAPNPNHWGNAHLAQAGHLYYSGTLWTLLAPLVLALTAAFPSRRTVAANAWALCALVVFVAALGDGWGLWRLMGKLPLLGKVNNNPFRLLCFLNLFTAMAGGLLLERALRAAGGARARTAANAVGLALCAVMLYHASMARSAFYTYGDRPYPPLPPAMEKLLAKGEGRVLPWAFLRSPEKGFTLSLMHAWPSYYGVDSFWGYDPIVEFKQEARVARSMIEGDPAGAARAFGIRWVVVPRFMSRPLETGYWIEKVPSLRAVVMDTLVATAKVVYDDAVVTVWELPEADPMAFPRGRPGARLPARLDSSGATVDLGGRAGGGEVVVNVTAWPAMEARVDGRAVAWRADEWWRVVVPAGAGARTLTVRYEAPWGRGLALGALLLLAAAAVSLALSPARRQPTPAP